METIEQQQEPVTPDAVIEAAPPAPEAPVADAPAAAVPPVDEFVPDFKYKFGGQEKEIDAFWRPLVKDKDSLQKVRDAIERSEALDMHKGKTKEFQEKLSQYEPVVQDVQKYQEMFIQATQTNDFGKHRELLQELGYTDAVLKDVVRHMLKEEQLPEEQKKYMQAQKQAELEKNQLVSQNEEVRAQYSDIVRDLTAQQMDIEFGKTDAQELIKAYEAANGNGSFREMFLQRGAYYVAGEGRHVPPSEVMGRILKEFNPFITKQVAGAPAPSQPAAVVREKPKVMPNVGAGNGAPTQGSVSSLDDLRKKYKQLTNQEG